MFDRNGNDAAILAHKITGIVVYFKNDFGFIRPDDKRFDDCFFHVTDVEPWREGFKYITGKVAEKTIISETGQKIVTPAFAGERVTFDIKKSGKTVTSRSGEKRDGLKAVNIELLTENHSSSIVVKEESGNGN